MTNFYRGLLVLSVTGFMAGCPGEPDCEDGDTDAACAVDECDSDDTDCEEDECDSDDTDCEDTEDPPLTCTTGDDFTAPGLAAPVTLGLDGLQVASAVTNVGATGFDAFTSWTCDSGTSAVLNIVQFDAGTYQWDEEHDLANSDHGDATALAHAYDVWGETLAHTDDLAGMGANDTLFNSDDDPGDGTFGNLTYVVRVYDDTSALADCIIFGADVALVKAGFTSNGAAPAPLTNAAELASCAEVN